MFVRPRFSSLLVAYSAPIMFRQLPLLLGKLFASRARLDSPIRKNASPFQNQIFKAARVPPTVQAPARRCVSKNLIMDDRKCVLRTRAYTKFSLKFTYTRNGRSASQLFFWMAERLKHEPACLLVDRES